MVLEIDGVKRRVSLGLKQTQRNPWEVFAETHPEGTEVEGEVKNITEFGLFIGLEGEIDGMVHLSDISWDERGEDAIQNYRKGDTVRASVSEVDVEKERISLSIKALGADSFAEATASNAARSSPLRSHRSKMAESKLSTKAPKRSFAALT